MLWIIKIPPWRPVRNMWFRSGSQSVNKIYLVIITTDPPQVVWILTSWYSLSYSKTAIHKRREIQESKRSELRHRGVKSIQRGESMNEHLTETRGDFRRKERVSEWVSEWDWERERERESLEESSTKIYRPLTDTEPCSKCCKTRWDCVRAYIYESEPDNEALPPR